MVGSMSFSSQLAFDIQGHILRSSQLQSGRGAPAGLPVSSPKQAQDDSQEPSGRVIQQSPAAASEAHEQPEMKGAARGRGRGKGKGRGRASAKEDPKTPNRGF